MNHVRGLRYLPKDSVFAEIDSPVGLLTIIASSAGLHAILWDNERQNSKYTVFLQALPQRADHPVILATRQQLNQYFQSQRKVFDLPLVLNGTPFQLQAWKQLLQIPYGATISYREQAEKLGNKNKCRAVGLANGQNPISIIIPCHRVIGSRGHLTGFAGGMDKKAYLLQLEQKKSLLNKHS